jgi:hemoglobin/transferrin/lactoferrin receptor protein
LAEIERIEVIRGPGSSLYGANAFSGVVNIITDSSKKRYLRGSVTTGSFLTSRAQAAFKQPAGPVIVRGNIEAFRSDGPFPEVERRQGSQIEAVKNDDVKSVSLAGSLEYHGLKLSARYTIGERGRPGNFPVDGSGRIQQCSNCHNADSSFGQGVKYPATQTSCGSCHIQASDRERNQQLNLALSYQRKVSKGWTVAGHAYHNEWRRDYRVREDDGFLRTSSIIEPELNQRTSGVEVRASHNYERSNALLFGGGAKYLASQSDLLFAEDGGNEAAQVEASGFVEDEFRPWSWLSLSAGTRLDYNSEFGLAVSPRGGVMVLPVPGLALRASVSRAFRNPSLSELYVVDDRGRYRVEGNPALDREWITNIEGGVGYTLTDPIKLRVGATVFHGIATDLIGFRAVDNDFATFFNIEGVTTTGVELEGELQFWDKPQLSGFVNYTFQRARTDGGDPLPYAPESKVNFGLRAAYKRAGGLIRIRYVGERQDDLEIDVPGFVTLDAAAHFDVWRGLSMQLWMQNLADESFQDSLGIPGAPRSFFVTLSYRNQ